MFVIIYIFFFKQKTAYDVRISYWSSDVCSSDLDAVLQRVREGGLLGIPQSLLVDRRTRLGVEAVLDEIPRVGGRLPALQASIERLAIALAIEPGAVVDLLEELVLGRQEPGRQPDHLADPVDPVVGLPAAGPRPLADAAPWKPAVP